MRKSFSEVFPSLKPPQELKGLLNHISVNKLKDSKDKQ